MAVALALAAACAAGGATAAPPSAAPFCPARLETQQSAAAPEGWSLERQTAPKPLSEIGFFEGPVADKVQLAPSRDGARASVWEFAAPRRPVRVVCAYRGTDVVLSRPLPPGVRSCTVATDARSPVLRPEALTCR